MENVLQVSGLQESSEGDAKMDCCFYTLVDCKRIKENFHNFLHSNSENSKKRITNSDYVRVYEKQ